jgi:hypothetical protein
VVQYGVPFRGTYRIEVTLYGKHVKGSPFTIWVSISVVPLVLLPVQLTVVYCYRASNKAGHEYSPHNCELIYDGELPTLVAGEYRTFTIVAKDSFGQQCLGTDPVATVRLGVVANRATTAC